MADYDYKAGKQRLEEILDNDMEVVEQDHFHTDRTDPVFTKNIGSRPAGKRKPSSAD